MIDLHTHTTFTDGDLMPSELIRRAEAKGYNYIAITDHGDPSNLDLIIPRIVETCRMLNRFNKVKAIPGIELTHVPPDLIGDQAEKARQLGARLILVHGETIVEPVAAGTNQKALEAPIDILAHPGLISRSQVCLARDRGIALEISGRSGHSLTNGHVAQLSREEGAKLTFGSDTHTPDNLTSFEQAQKICLGAGMNNAETKILFDNAKELADNAIAKMNMKD
ncbi:MAG: histidinol phosphate phosphatase domain-containing protein [Fidelibacterota bacterium]